MSRRKEHGRVVFDCDFPGCPAECETGEGRPGVAKQIARSKRWSIGDVSHYCPVHA